MSRKRVIFEKSRPEPFFSETQIFKKFQKVSKSFLKVSADVLLENSMWNVFWKNPKNAYVHVRARASAVSQAFFATKTQGRFPFGGHAASGISLCGCV